MRNILICVLAVCLVPFARPTNPPLQNPGRGPISGREYPKSPSITNGRLFFLSCPLHPCFLPQPSLRPYFHQPSKQPPPHRCTKILHKFVTGVEHRCRVGSDILKLLLSFFFLKSTGRYRSYLYKKVSYHFSQPYISLYSREPILVIRGKYLYRCTISFRSVIPFPLRNQHP